MKKRPTGSRNHNQGASPSQKSIMSLLVILHDGAKSSSSHKLTKLVSDSAELWKLPILEKPHILEHILEHVHRIVSE